MTASKFIRPELIARTLDLSRSAAYDVAHRLGAVKVGRSLRLSREIWEAYLRSLANPRRPAFTGEPETAGDDNEARAASSTPPLGASHRAARHRMELDPKTRARLAKVAERGERMYKMRLQKRDEQ